MNLKRRKEVSGERRKKSNCEDSEKFLLVLPYDVMCLLPLYSFVIKE